MKVVKSTEPCRCCWHCRYYIRPSMTLTIDGPVSRVCTIDRKQNHYLNPDQKSPCDKTVLPDDYCGLFEIDPPPFSD